MSQVTRLAELLGLAGVEVDVVEREHDGSWTAHVRSASGRQACCPGCGRAAQRVKERTAHSFKHLRLVAVRVTWHKSRFWCNNAACGAGSFAEAGSAAGPGSAVSVHAKKVMGHLVGDWLVPASRVAAGAGAGAGVSWHTAHDAFAGVAAQAGIHLSDTTTGTSAERGGAAQTSAEARTETGAETKTSAVPGTVGSASPARGVPATRACRSVAGILPPVDVLGIDDHRRGKPLYHRDPASGAWVADADRWARVFVDAAGGHGLLGQVEGRAAADVTAWLAAQEAAWLAAVSYVTIDMSSVYKSAVTTSGLLPNARLVVDGLPRDPNWPTR